MIVKGRLRMKRRVSSRSTGCAAVEGAVASSLASSSTSSSSFSPVRPVPPYVPWLAVLGVLFSAFVVVAIEGCFALSSLSGSPRHSYFAFASLCSVLLLSYCLLSLASSFSSTPPPLQ